MQYRFPPEIDASELVQSLVDRFDREPALAVIGPHGTGKTTLLHCLKPRLEAGFGDVRYVRLNSSSKPVSPVEATRMLAHQGLVVIDGFEQLPLASRLVIVAYAKFGRQAGRLLATAHRRQWLVPTFFCTRWDATIVRDLTAEKLAGLTAWQRAAMQPIADRLAQQHLGDREVGSSVPANVRDYWFSLYDAYEELRSESTATPSGTVNSQFCRSLPRGRDFFQT